MIGEEGARRLCEPLMKNTSLTVLYLDSGERRNEYLVDLERQDVE